MPINLSIDQKALLELSVTDRGGNATTFDDVPVWESSSENLTLEPSEDGMSCWAKPKEEVEEAVLVTVTGDADLDDGEERYIIGSLQVNVTGGEAMFVSIMANDPVSKDAAPDQTLPGDLPTPDNSLPVDPGAPPVVDNTLPGDLPVVDNSLPEEQPVEPTRR